MHNRENQGPYPPQVWADCPGCGKEFEKIRGTDIKYCRACREERSKENVRQQIAKNGPLYFARVRGMGRHMIEWLWKHNLYTTTTKMELEHAWEMMSDDQLREKP